MKKLLSVLLSIMMLAAVGTSFAVPAFAATNVHSPSGEVIPGEGNTDKDHKAPPTGAASIGLATTAALGAGAALTLLKKKDAE